MSDADLLHEEPPGYGSGGKPAPLTEYLRKLERALKRGDATEHTHRPALKELIEALDETGHRHQRTETFRLRRARLRRVPQARPAFPRLHRSQGHRRGPRLRLKRGEQLKRYLASLPNLLLTDYVEFRWFVDGKKRETFRLANVAAGGKLTPVSPDEMERARTPARGFLTQRPVDIASAEELAAPSGQSHAHHPRHHRPARF